MTVVVAVVVAIALVVVVAEVVVVEVGVVVLLGHTGGVCVWVSGEMMIVTK